MDRRIKGKADALQEQITANKKKQESERAEDKAETKELRTEVREAVRAASRAEIMTEMLLKSQGIRPPPKVEVDGGNP